MLSLFIFVCNLGVYFFFGFKDTDSALSKDSAVVLIVYLL